MSDISSKNEGLLVIGAGQMRTGTMSLKTALEILYKGEKCYHMMELVTKNIHHLDLWISACDKKHLSKEVSDEIFKCYKASVDFPASILYKDLMEHYPNAKVILTSRDSKGWVKSVRSTTMSGDFWSLSHKIIDFFTGKFSKFEVFRKKIFKMAYNVDENYFVNNDELLMKCYEDFNEEVRRTVPKDRLLEFKQGDGWEKMCEFLDKPIPSVPYPHVNTTKEFHQHKNSVFTMSSWVYVASAIIIVVPAVAIAYVRRR